MDSHSTIRSPAVIAVEISVIVPVRNNQAGLDQLLDLLLGETGAPQPLEVIVVDSASAVPVVLQDRHRRHRTDVRLVCSAQPGAATARNVGAAAARGQWLLFTDSDCMPTATFITGYVGIADVVACAGAVRGTPASLLTHFYESERSLSPKLKIKATGEPVPLYLVTANALIWKPAFVQCGCFDERFPRAGGEDVELSLRLWRHGPMVCADESVVLHDFSDGIAGFWSRFCRYGYGNAVLEEIADITMKPRWIPPASPSRPHRALKIVQFLGLCMGYYCRRALTGMRQLALRS